MHANGADDIALLVKNAERYPHLTHLVSRAADQRTCEILSTTNKHKNTPAFMKKIAQKGAKSVRLITRTGKILHKGHLAQFLLNLLGVYFYLLCTILISLGTFFIYRALRRISPLRKVL